MVQANRTEVEQVDASATAQVLGHVGAAGDHVSHLIISPKTGSPGVVTLIDGSTDYPIYYGGTDATLRPFTIVVDLTSRTGAWKVTTGSNVHVIAVGRFT